MSGWFERQARGRREADVAQEHARYLRAAGVDRALDLLAGPFGLRRFLVVFAARPAGGGRSRVEVTDLVSLPLTIGGGPPPPDPGGERRAALAQALGRLHANMATGPSWSRGVLGYLRDAQGKSQVLPLFDEDSDRVGVDALPMPQGPGHPLEHPQTQQLLAHWEPRMQAIHARSAQIRGDWDLWTVDGGELVLCYDPQGEDRWGERRRFRCQPLATFHQGRQRWTWATDRRPGDPRLFAADELVADWAAATELALLTAAGLGASWLFSGEFGEQGALLLAAVFEA